MSGIGIQPQRKRPLRVGLSTTQPSAMLSEMLQFARSCPPKEIAGPRSRTRLRILADPSEVTGMIINQLQLGESCKTPTETRPSRFSVMMMKSAATPSKASTNLKRHIWHMLQPTLGNPKTRSRSRARPLLRSQSSVNNSRAETSVSGLTRSSSRRLGLVRQPQNGPYRYSPQSRLCALDVTRGAISPAEGRRDEVGLEVNVPARTNELRKQKESAEVQAPEVPEGRKQVARRIIELCLPQIHRFPSEQPGIRKRRQKSDAPVNPTRFQLDSDNESPETADQLVGGNAMRRTF